MPESKVLIVEDDKTLGPLIQDLLESEGLKTRHARRLEEGWAVAREWLPDALVLDLGLPDGDGLSLCRRIRKDAGPLSACGVLILTAKGSKDDVVRGLEEGADDYLTKPYNERELVARLRALLRRREAPAAPTGPEQLSLGKIRLNPQTHEAWVAGQALGLTLREFELLRVLLEHKDQALSRERILDLAWSDGAAMVPKVVDVHCHYLRKKLGPEAARLISVPQVGYRLLAKLPA